MTSALIVQAKQYLLDSIKSTAGPLFTELSKLGIITKDGTDLEISKLILYYKTEPIVYNPNLSELEIINLLQNINLNEILELVPYEKYLGKNLDNLGLTPEEKEKVEKCAVYREVYGISTNDEYIKYLIPDYLYNFKLNARSYKKDKSRIIAIKQNMDKTVYNEYTLASYFHEIYDTLNYIQKLGIVDFSDVTFNFGDKQAVFPSPLQYINAATIVGISCQEVSPGGSKSISLLRDPNKISMEGSNLKVINRIPTDLVRAKLFELMLNAGYNPFTCFAINDFEVSYGHSQAILRTYDLLTYHNGKPTDLTKLNHTSISKFFDFFNRKEFVSLTTEQKQYLQLPFVFEECTASKDQILFTYYLALYNIKKLMTEYMNPNKNQSERTFIIANSFAKASESERFRFVSAVTAGFHHMGEPVALDFFLKTIHTLLPHANNNPNFEEVLESMTLDEITTRFIKILRSSASYHAKTSMNVGEIVSRWYIEEELIPSTEADSSTIKTAKRQFENKINNLINKFLKRDLDNTVPLELDKPPVEITGEEQEGVEFNCTFGRKKNLIVQSTRTKNDIYKYSKNEFVEYYTFSYPQWASPHYSLSHVLKDSDVDLITQIHIFNNLDRDNPERMLRSTGDSNSKDPMRTAMVFWIPIDYIRLEGPELGEIVIHNNTLEKTEKALEEFCIGGASEENLRLIQLTSNIHNMNEPNDRLLIPYSILKTPYKRKIDENSK